MTIGSYIMQRSLSFLAAMITIFGFIRFVKKKIDYKDEDDDDIDRQE